MTNLTRAALSAALTFILFGQAAIAQRAAQNAPGDMHWVATWAAAEQQPRAAGLGRGRGPGPAPVSNVNGAAPASDAAPRPAPPPSSFQNQTVRMIVRTSLGGNRVRVHLSNAFGATPLRIGAAHVALRDMESSIVAGSDRPLAFSGASTVTIPPGAEMLSDPVDLNVPKLSDLAISVFVPAETGPASVHSMGLHTTYISKDGDFTAAPQIADATTSQAWYWVSAVDVMAPANAGTIVAFGDSITDGATSTPNTNGSWPSVLAARLLANPATANVAIVNLGISGNRVLGDGAGVSALARFDRDVIAQAGVKWVMIMESINDIGLGARNGSITADALIGALHQMIERAHTHGIKVVGCTLTPYVGASYASDEGEAMRMAINTFIRTPGNFDAFVDYDQVTRDPANPKQILKEFNNTDHLHPNDAGYKAMADSVDLSIFASAPAARGRK
jgi:lysophospholipase L1-like esterase